MRNLIIVIASFIISCNSPKKEIYVPESGNLADIASNMSGLALFSEIHNERNDIYCFLLPNNKTFNKKSLAKEAKVINSLLWKKGKEVSLRFYDHPNTKDLFDIYPLEKEDYIFMAEHYVGEYTTYSNGIDDSFAYMYPFINSQYKKFGGKNFAKFEKLQN